jgi:serine/threonine protein kinase
MDSFWASIQTGGNNNPSSVGSASQPLNTWRNILITLACSDLNDLSINDRIYPALGSHLGTGMTFSVERKEAKGRKLVAVKHIRKAFIQSNNDSTIPGMKGILGAVLLEIKVLLHLNSLQHRNIVRLLGYGWDDGPVPYLVLEYADLGSLDEFLQGNKQPWAEKDRVAIGLASALEMLHACEVIHGDIKLGNILVFANRKRGFDAKLADFGFSCSTALGQRTFRGTRVFNAPEIRCQTALVDDVSVYEKADVYSYGLALWEILNDGRRYYSSPPINIVSGEDGFESACAFLADLDSREAEIIPYAISSLCGFEMPQEMAGRMISVVEITLLHDVDLRADIRDVRETIDPSGQYDSSLFPQNRSHEGLTYFRSEPEIALPLLMPCYSIFDVC